MYKVETSRRIAVAKAREGKSGPLLASSVEVFQKNARNTPATIGRTNSVGVIGMTPTNAVSPTKFACGSISRRKLRAEPRSRERKNTNVTFTKTKVTNQLTQPGIRFFFLLQI